MARRDSASYDITARDLTRAGIESARRGFGDLDATIAKVTGGFSILAAAATVAPAAIIRSQAGAIERLSQTAQSAGIATESMQAFGAAASRAGIDSEGIYDTLAEMQLRLSEAARGGGEATEALDALGLSAEALVRLSPEQQFRALTEALAGVASQADRISFADQLLGEDGKEVIRILADDVDAARERFERLGLAISSVDAAAVIQMNQELRGTNGLVTGAAQVFTAELAPALVGITTATLNTSEGVLSIREAAEITADGFVTAVGRIGNGLEGLDNIVESVKIGLQALNVGAASIADFFDGSEESAARLAETERVLQGLKDNLSGQTGDATFLEKLRSDVDAARERAAEAGLAIDALREKNQRLVREGGRIGGDPAAAGAAGAIAKAAANADRELERLAASLGEASSSAEAELGLRLRAIDDFRQQYPERAREALAAEVAAYSDRDRRLAGIGAERIDVGIELVGATNVAVLEADATRLRDAGATRDEVLDAAGAARASIDVGVELTGATNTAALADDGLRVAAALADRDAVLERAAGRDVDIGGAVTADAAGAVADELGLGTDRLETEVDRRAGAFEALVTPRVVAGIDLTDGAAAAADTLAAGTRALELETRVRGELLAGLDGSRLATAVELEDGAATVAAEIVAGTERLVGAAEARPARLGAASSARVALGLDLEDDAGAVALLIDGGTRAVERSGTRRDQVLAELSTSRVRAVVDLTDEADAASRAVAAGTDALEGALDGRSDALDGARASRVVAGVELVDETGPAIAELEAGREAFEAVIARRVGAFEALARPRVVAGIDLTDEAARAVDTLAEGTRQLRLQTEVRGELLAGLDGTRVTTAVGVDDEAPEAAADIDAATGELVDALRRRPGELSGVGATRLLAGVELVDGAFTASTELDAGTAALDAALGRRAGELGASPAARIRAGIEFEDDAAGVAASIGAGTAGIADAIGVRAAALAGLDGATSERPVLDFDLEFPEFDAGVQRIREDAAAQFAELERIGTEFPAKAAEVARLQVLALAKRDQDIADYRAAARDAREREDLDVTNGIGTLIGELRSETASVRAEYAERVALIQEYGQLQGVAEQEVTDLLAATLEDRNAKLAAIGEARTAQQQADFQQTFDLAAQAATGVLGLFEKQIDGEIQITEKMSAEEKKRAKESNARNRKRFEDNKRYQQGQAYINTLAGISQVLGDATLSFYEKGFAIAATVAQGAALVSQIRGATYGTGASPSSGAAGGGGGAGGGGADPNDTRLADSVAPEAAAPNQPVIIIAGDGAREIGTEEAERIVTRGLDAARRSRRVRWANGAAPAVTQFDVERV